MLKQFIRLPHERHAIKEAAISLFFGSQFVRGAALHEVLVRELGADFNQVKPLQSFVVKLTANLSYPAEAAADQQLVGLPGVQAVQLEDGTVVRMLQARNEDDRTSLTLHNLRYERWADFLALFQRLAQALAPALSNMVVLAASLHYVDELTWVHPTDPLPLRQIYQDNPAYLPQHFFDSPASELLLTVPTSAADISFFDRLHITSLGNNNQPVVTISHHLVHQFAAPNQDLGGLLTHPDQLTNVLRQAHEQNKAVLRKILQPEVLTLIGLNL